MPDELKEIQPPPIGISDIARASWLQRMLGEAGKAMLPKYLHEPPMRELPADLSGRVVQAPWQQRLLGAAGKVGQALVPEYLHEPPVRDLPADLSGKVPTNQIDPGSAAAFGLIDLATTFTPAGVAKGAIAAGAGVAARQAGKRAPRAAGSELGAILRGAEDLPAPGIGHNMPPPEAVMMPEEIIPPKTWAQGLPRPQPAKRGTEVPDIREMPAAEAIETARKQHHLVKSGEQSEGMYVGAPREMQSRQALTQARKAFDEYIARDPRGGDWYDRYRGGLGEVTGGDPVQNRWMAAQEGQFSAGVDPGSELHFALMENNAAIAGMPTKAARPAQHEAHMAALAAKDPSLYLLGEKTGEYARLVNPDQLRPPGATGVNDFRHARNWGYTEAGGEAQRDALTSAQHRFLDYETALAVDRANRVKLGGREDWTGEKIQAAPWVVQKALDFMSRNPKLSYDDAFARANRTITDYFPKHTYFATHEQQPGADVAGHMARSVEADPAARQAFFADPRSTWATAPGERDAIYSGLGVEGTGNVMRVRPTVPMQGMYRTPAGTLETNPGEVARPLGTFTTGGQGFKEATPHDRAILDAGEALRAYLDAQNAGAWHKVWAGGPVKESASLFFPRQGQATLTDLASIQQAGSKYGLTDVADTGQGITATRFYPPPEGGKEFDKAVRGGEFTQFGEAHRVKVDSGYIDFVEKWKEGVGSGAATRHMLEYVNKTPELRAAFNNNPHIAERALARLERDEDWAKAWGVPREDIQNARRIIGQGKGGIDRLDAALKAGAILPAVAAAIYSSAGVPPPGETAPGGRGAGREEF